MNDLITLLERYAPGYSTRIQGASDWALSSLEEAFGQPLPETYQDFAREMGKDGGALLAHVDDYDPLHIADIYQFSAGELPPRRFLFIFADPSPLTRSHYWLDLEAQTEEGDFQVVRFPLFQDAWKTDLNRSYVSLREMLYLWAMEYVYLPGFPHRTLYHQGDGQKTTTAEELAQYFEKMGFVRLPYPRYSMLFERGDAAIGLYRLPDSPHFQIHVGMRSLDKLKYFQAVVEDNTDIKKSIWPP